MSSTKSTDSEELNIGTGANFMNLGNYNPESPLGSEYLKPKPYTPYSNDKSGTMLDSLIYSLEKTINIKINIILIMQIVCLLAIVAIIILVYMNMTHINDVKSIITATR